jgi:hypothetical protein
VARLAEYGIPCLFFDGSYYAGAHLIERARPDRQGAGLARFCLSAQFRAI